MRHPAFNLSAAALVLFSGPAFADTCRTLASLDWLLGQWVAEGAQSTIRESWTARSSTTWEGEGSEASKADPAKTSREDLRLVEMSHGVYYLAKVAHNELPVAFRLSECADDRFVFVNPAHDFPKRLDYVREGGDRLSVRVSDGAGKGFTLNFVRAASRRPRALKPFSRPRTRASRQWSPRIRTPCAAVLADDLGYVHSTGRVENREQLIDSIVSGKLRYLSIEPSERHVSLQGPTAAIVQGIVRIQARAGDQAVDFPARYLAVYGLEDGDWRLRAWQSLRLP